MKKYVGKYEMFFLGWAACAGWQIGWQSSSVAGQCVGGFMFALAIAVSFWAKLKPITQIDLAGHDIEIIVKPKTVSLVQTKPPAGGGSVKLPGDTNP